MLKHYLSEEVLDRNSRANKAKSALPWPVHVLLIQNKQELKLVGPNRVREMFTGVLAICKL